MFQSTFGMCLRGAYLSMHRRFNIHFAQFGATADQFVVLTLLAEGEGMTQKELVERSCSDPNTIAAMLNLLQARDLLKRERHPQDGRARSIYLTDQGRDKQRQLYKSAEPLLNALNEEMDHESREIILESLERVKQKTQRCKPARSKRSTPTADKEWEVVGERM